MMTHMSGGARDIERMPRGGFHGLCWIEGYRRRDHQRVVHTVRGDVADITVSGAGARRPG
jgi:hypothetical protein